MKKISLEEMNSKLDMILSKLEIKLDKSTIITEKSKTVAVYNKIKYEVPSDSDLRIFKNGRAFFKKYAKNLSGAQKMVLVVFFLTKGETEKDVSYEAIVKEWNKFSGILGGKLESRTYFTRARGEDWINSLKHGFYFLTDNWKTMYEK